MIQSNRSMNMIHPPIHYKLLCEEVANQSHMTNRFILKETTILTKQFNSNEWEMKFMIYTEPLMF
ncbi:hypothetical protein GV64_20925 [Endozoicomonas elysicola]|uniref:Uncharacterized protein n=1 Tax=Endozoicomonas elysicola TaxID=305900 RepID=A0A081KFC8_9GAMM|nr:hypothetical protein GV64_20925 [Endozoicomonas elysicola]